MIDLVPCLVFKLDLRFLDPVPGFHVLLKCFKQWLRINRCPLNWVAEGFQFHFQGGMSVVRVLFNPFVQLIPIASHLVLSLGRNVR